MTPDQPQDRGAALKAAIDQANLGAMDDVSFQACRDEVAKKLGVDLIFLKKQRRLARARHLAALNGGAAKTPAEDPWSNAPFIPLGVRGTDVVLFSQNTKQVVVGSGRHLLLYAGNFNFFHSIAPGGKDGSRIDWDRAESAVLERAKAAGPFDPARVRSRGAWLDQVAGESQLLLNVGNKLVVKGENGPLGLTGRFIYTGGIPIDLPAKLPPPASIDDARTIFELFRALSWRFPDIDPLLLIGFIVVGQIGGALSWRPSIWLTGSSQNGKTTLRDRAIIPLMPFSAGSFGAGSTEAGIRQSLGGDSLPWCFDEAESETGLSNIRKVMGLLRGNSSAITGERSAKGSTGGRPLTFELRSCGLLSSIGSSAERAADISRLTAVELLKSSSTDYRANIEPRWASITRQLGFKVFSRIVNGWPLLLRGIEQFKPLVERRAGSARAGDQLGTLLAGAFFLEHDGEASDDEIERWLDKIRDWGDHGHAARVADGDESDEHQCFTSILSMHVDLTLNDDPLPTREGEPTRVRSHRDRRTIAELIGIARGAKDSALDAEDCHAQLARYGICIDGSQILIANQHDALRKLLAGHPWAVNWRALLRRLLGATPGEGPRKFAGVLSRYTSVPASLIDEVVCEWCGIATPAESVNCGHCLMPLGDARDR